MSIKGKIILVGGQKGGSGKSNTAQTLASDLTINHKADCVLVDADPQGTTNDWRQLREGNGFHPISCVQATGKIHETLTQLAEKYPYVVVDAGGQDNIALRTAMIVADIMIIPFRPKNRDLKTIIHMSNVVEEATAINRKLITRGLITQCPTLPSQVKRIENAKACCLAADIRPLDTLVYTRNAYDDCDETGSSIFEHKDDRGAVDKKAVDEAKALTDEILTILEVKGMENV